MPELRVKNTFFEVEADAPAANALRRTQSEQAHGLPDAHSRRPFNDSSVPPMPEQGWARIAGDYQPADAWAWPSPAVWSPQPAAPWAASGWDAATSGTAEVVHAMDPWSASQWGAGPAVAGVMFVPLFTGPGPLPYAEQLAAQALRSPSPPALQRSFSVTSHLYRVSWSVDASILHGSTQESVSPPFALSFSRDVQFELVVQLVVPTEFDPEVSPEVVPQGPEGHGRVLLRRCEEVDETISPLVTFRFTVGNARRGREPPRGPVCHDFAVEDTCGLPKSMEVWDFAKHVDQENGTFIVSLEVIGNGSKSDSKT